MDPRPLDNKARTIPRRESRNRVCLVSTNTILQYFLADPSFETVIIELTTLDILKTTAEQLTRIGRDHALVLDETAFTKGHDEVTAASVVSPLILLADIAARPLVRRFFMCGGSAVVPTSAPKPIFIGALKLALAGEVYAPPDLWYGGLMRVGATANAEEEADGMDVVSPLTDRENDVLMELCEGKNNKLIAHALDIAEPTVKMHLSSISRKLGASNRTQIVTRALEIGLLHSP